MDNVIIRNSKIFYKNFSGKETAMNRAGDRNFCAYIENPEMAEAMSADGWNVKDRNAKDPDAGPKYFIKVKVRFRSGEETSVDKNSDPKLWKVTSKKKTLLDKEAVGSLDGDQIIDANLNIRPYHWKSKDGTKEGISGYLEQGYFRIVDDPFEEEYEDLETEE